MNTAVVTVSTEVFPSALILHPSKGARDLDDFEHLELIGDLEVVEVLERQAALEAGLDLAHVVLEALERIELAFVDYHVGSQQPYLGVAAPHEAFGDVAARDRPDT